MRSTGFLLIVLQIVNGNLVDTTTLSPLETTESDPCAASHEIESADRVVSSAVTSGRCDVNLNTGWYRFTVNNVSATLPTVCLRPGACGGDVSLRIDLGDQTLPGVGEEVEAWSCGAFDILGKFDCCVLRQPARIRNCSRFLVYKLQKPDRCDVTYCVEHPVEKIPSNVLVKNGEDVSPQSTTPSTSTVTTQDNLNRCIEGMVLCTRGAPRCMSYEDCLAIPLTTTSSSDITTATNLVTTPASVTETTPPVTTEKTTVDSHVKTTPNIAEKTTSDNDVTTTQIRADETTLDSDVTTAPNKAGETTLDSSTTPPPPPPPHIETTESTSDDGITSPGKGGTTTGSGLTSTDAEVTTASQTTSQTTVLRGLYPVTTTSSPTDDSTSTEGSTSRRHTSTASVTTTGDYSTTGSTGGMPGHPDGVSRTDATSTDGPSTTVKTTEAAPGQTADSSSTSSSTTAAAGGHVERSTNQEMTSSISTTSATTAAPSSTAMASTTAPASVTQSTSETLPPVHSTEGASSTSPSFASSESSDVTTDAGSTKSTRTSPLGPVDGRIVLEYPADTLANYSASVKTCMSYLLNTYDEKGRTVKHAFTTDDVNVMTVDTSSTTTTVVLRVEDSVQSVVMDAGDLIHMLKYLQEKNKLNDSPCKRNLGTIQDFYRYGEHPTTPPPKSMNSYSLFYDKLPLFIAIIVMVTVCFLILIFGIVYLRCFHHQRTWDRTKDVERAKLKEAKEHKGLENPVPDSEMMKDEAVVTETSLTVNGSHHQHPTPIDDDKGWVVPIDQAPGSQGQIALKSEDTQL